MGLCTALTCHVEGHVFTQKISDHLMGSAVALILEPDPSQRNEMFRLSLGTCPFGSSSSQSENTTRCRRELPRKDRAKRVHTTVQIGGQGQKKFPIEPLADFRVDRTVEHVMPCLRTESQLTYHSMGKVRGHETLPTRTNAYGPGEASVKCKMTAIFNIPIFQYLIPLIRVTGPSTPEAHTRIAQKNAASGHLCKPFR
jgi:hypothetical protein